MFNNIALDVFIGLVFIFLLYSLLATIIQEIIATRFAFRAKLLEKSILRMLEDGKTTTPFPYVDRINGILHLFGIKNLMKRKTVAPWFYAHPLIKYLAEDNYYSKPAYLDATNFSKVMIDLLKGFGQPESQTIQSIHNSILTGSIHKLPINISTIESDSGNPVIKILRKQNPGLPTASEIAEEVVQLNTNTALFLRSIWQDSGADIDVFRDKLEKWFNDTQERTTGWYKKYTRIVLFFVGLVLAYVFNVDTIAIHRILSTNRIAREQMVQIAISNKDNLDPKTVLNDQTLKSDSLLAATYKMVANDANQANDILGLGKPWKDSCKICDSIYGCKEENAEFIKKKDSLTAEKILVESITKLLEAEFKSKKALSDSLKNKQDLQARLSTTATAAAILTLNSEIKNLDSIIDINSIELKKHDEKGMVELARLLALSQRCPIIIKESKTWFRYGPNQTGGMETLLGWLIAALAITLGAPFWFDLLSKLISLRGAGAKLTPTDDDGSKVSLLNSNAPVNPTTVNVNSNPGEEAVG